MVTTGSPLSPGPTIDTRRTYFFTVPVRNRISSNIKRSPPVLRFAALLAHIVSPDCGDYLENIAASAASITPYFGQAQSMAMPSYRDSIAEVDLLNMQTQRQQQLDSGYAREINDFQRQRWDDPRERTKALNALQLKYQRLRLEATQQQNQALIQQELQRREQRGQLLRQ